MLKYLNNLMGGTAEFRVFCITELNNLLSTRYNSGMWQ